ncbi:hypothetical protein V8E36_000930 [Tilletia maclaganii]
MGVKLLWQELEDAAQETTLEILSAAAFLYDSEVTAASGKDESRRHGPVRRHLVLGIDASIWLFHAMSLKHTAGDRGEIRMLFFRLAKLHALPIMPIFVFDGPGRPRWKRNKQRGHTGNARYSFPNQADFEQLIHLFGFAVYHAPAEAEAQLAKMNADGVVDAILTDDGDAFLFGAQVVLRNSSKTLSGSQARATRLRQQSSDGNSDAESSEAMSQDSASSSRSASSQRRRAKGKQREQATPQPSDGEDMSSGTDSAYMPTSSGTSVGTVPSKGNLPAISKPQGALTGKIEESYTVYRSFLIFDTSRSHADERLFGSRRPLGAPAFYKPEEPPTKSLNQDGLILTALLNGGDYDVQGLPRCGIKTAIALARCGYGKRLLDSFKKHFQPPPHAPGVATSSSRTSAAWDRELTAWVNDVRDELRNNSHGLLERKATKLASSDSWEQFLRTEQALEVVRSYVWPGVVSVTLEQVLEQSRQKFTKRTTADLPTSAGLPSFHTAAGPSRVSSALRSHPIPPTSAELTQAQCNLTELCTFTQILFGWDTDQALKRFSNLVWDGCVLRRAISLNLALDQKRDAGLPIPEPRRNSKGSAPASPKKTISRRASDKSLGDVTITPQAKRFADFFEKKAVLESPKRVSTTSKSKAGATSSPEQDLAAMANSLGQGEITVLAVHSSRKHAAYGGLASEVRLSYATDGLKKAVEKGLVSEWARGEDGLYALAQRRTDVRMAQDGDSDGADSVSEDDGKAASVKDDEEEVDEFITLSQVKRKQQAKTKVNENRMWIPRIYLADLPFFHESGLGEQGTSKAAAWRAPKLLLEDYDQLQRDKAEKERIKASNREAKKMGKKPVKIIKPEAGQRSVADFFAISGKGKAPARAGLSNAKAGPSMKQRAEREAKAEDSFSSDDSFPEHDRTARTVAQTRSTKAGAKTPAVVPTSSRIQIPQRARGKPESSSESDHSIVILEALPAPTAAQTRASQSRLTKQNPPPPPSQSRVAKDPAVLLSQTTSEAPSSSEVDELVDEGASQATVIEPSQKTVAALPSFTSGLSHKYLTSSEDEEEDADDSLPDILSQKYRESQSQSQTQKQVMPRESSPVLSRTGATMPKTRAASRSPGVTSADEASHPSRPDGGSNGTRDEAIREVQRSPRKSPRKNQAQTYAWSSSQLNGPSTSSSSRNAGSSQGGRRVLPSAGGSHTQHKAEAESIDLADFEDKDEYGGDEGEGQEGDWRPASPSPLPKRTSGRNNELSASQDTSASFEIVGFVPARSKGSDTAL